MMTKTRLSMAAACLTALLATSTAAHAQDLLTWTFKGFVDTVTPAYNYNSSITDAQRATIDHTLASYTTGHGFTATVTIDLNASFNTEFPAHQSQQMFPGAIKSYDLSIPDFGVLTHLGAGPLNDLRLHDFPIIIRVAPGPSMQAVTAPELFPGDIVFRNLAYVGSTRDLHDLLQPAMQVPENYSFTGGVANIAAPGCASDNMCGNLGLHITSISVSAVPEPSTWATLTLGMLVVAPVLARRRKQGLR